MPKHKCDYCDATTNKSIAETDWLAMHMRIGQGKDVRVFMKKACPEHVGKLTDDADKFYRGSIYGQGDI